MFELIRAARLFGNAVRLRERGRRAEAFDSVERALALLSKPQVNKLKPAAFTLFNSCTHEFVRLALDRGDKSRAAEALDRAMIVYRQNEAKYPMNEQLREWGVWMSRTRSGLGG
jgi:hypothetical protein